MEINERIIDGLTVLDLMAKLTITDGAQQLKDKIDRLVRTDRNQIIVNLARVPYIDSGGLGQLVACHTAVRKAGGKLTLLNVNKRNHDLLSITKLYFVFDTFDNERDAVASYRVPVPVAMAQWSGRAAGRVGEAWTC